MVKNRNFIKTENAIRDALTQLIKERGNIENITVINICEKADISKSTFYCHYNNIYELCTALANELIDILEDTMDNYITSHNDIIYPYVHAIFIFLKEHEEFYKAVVNTQYPLDVLDRLKKISLERFSKDTKITRLSKNERYKKVEISFAANGMIDLVVDYFRGKLNVSLEELEDIITDILNNLIH